tara:strand:+ start:4711 stop:5121 length:411 start_codon:yes stop_codon:yes gene_type:complete
MHIWNNFSNGMKACTIGLVLLIALLAIGLIVINVQKTKLENQAIDLIEKQKSELGRKKEHYEGVIFEYKGEIKYFKEEIVTIKELRKKDQEDAKYWYERAQQRKSQIDGINKKIADMDSSELRSLYTAILAEHNLN